MAPIIQLFMLGYAATTDVQHVPIVVADADRSRASRDLIALFNASPYFEIVDVVTSTNEIDPTSRAAARGWRSRFRPAYGDTLAAGRPADGTGYCRRQRRELDQRGARLRRESGRRLRGGVGSKGRKGESGRSGWRGWRNHRAGARVVQPTAREPRFHDPRGARAAPARRDDEPVGDGRRAREGTGDARTAERHAAPAVGAHRRKTAAVCADRDD